MNRLVEKTDLELLSSDSKIEELTGENIVFPDLYRNRNWPVITGAVSSLSDRDSRNQTETTGGSELPDDEFSSVEKNIVANAPSFSTDRKNRKSPLVWYVPKPLKQSYFQSLQKWRGVVLESYDDSFLSRLVDMDGLSPDEEAEIYMAEVSDEDKALITPGAVFYWNIGYHVNPAGQKKRSSIIRFRRLPIWTASEIDEAESKAEQTLATLGLK